VKKFDAVLDVYNFENLLIPFSHSMSYEQWKFYKAEAELPGITAQFARMLVGGLLRKQPILKLPATVPAEAHDWLMNQFCKDNSPMTAFLDEALWEEMQSSRCWVFLDYPNIANPDAATPEDIAGLKPYPVIHKAEHVINWKLDTRGLCQVIVRGFEEVYHDDDEFHPKVLDTCWVHELTVEGFYQVRVFQETGTRSEDRHLTNTTIARDLTEVAAGMELKTTFDNILAHGSRLTSIPAWPLNGSPRPVQPLLSAIVDKEISLYNKVSRRNHLLYGAATYTPVICADLTDDAFDEIVEAGLGSWIKLPMEGKATVLDTPTAALADMDRAIASAIEEIARLGVRMLSPENVQSGVALEIRNAAQTAQLGVLSNKISHTMRAIIHAMISWRYEIEVPLADIEFTLSTDFDPVPLGADWLRLATEWYEKGLIPRTLWLQLLKSNDMIDPSYDDEDGKKEITADETIQSNTQKNDSFANSLNTSP
jgi:hypothetical protein